MFERERQQMIDDIEVGVAITHNYIGRDHLDARVMDAIREVPREKFVPADMQSSAFNNGALPIGHGQTISQPYIVALMTDLLDLNPASVILEIGTGSGYQAAVLSLLAGQVYSIERVPELAQAAQQRLKNLGYENIETRCSNGYLGWPEQAPFDGIVVTAASADIPPALVEQLKPGGRMIIPVGLPHRHQELMLIVKDQQGELQTSELLAVAFVPLINGD